MKKSKVVLVLLLIFCLFQCSGMVVCAMDSSTNRIELSPEERSYMEQKKVLRVSIVTDWRPYSYESEDGAYQGVPIMILNRLTEETGVVPEFVLAKNYSESLKQLQNGTVDVIGILAEEDQKQIGTTEERDVEMVPYIVAQAMLIQHKNTNLTEISKVTMADIRGRTMFLNSQQVVPIYYDNSQKCLNAVRCGQSDATICDSFTAAMLMQQYQAKDLMSIPAGAMINLGFGLLSNADERLVSVLEKTIASFAGGDITRNLIGGSDYDPDNFLEFAYRYPFEIICFGAALMFVIGLCLVTYTKINIRQHQSLQGYEESYRLLSDTFGEAGMEYDYRNDSLTVFGKHSNLDMDQKVENFKESLQNRSVRILLTAEQFDRIVQDGVENQSFSTEFQCGVKSGEWVWYRLIYTVICTTESHRRPIRLVGCLANVDAEHVEMERLLKLSSNDQLTGLLNRKVAEETISSLLEEDVVFHTGMLVVLDIDSFKKFNDEKGHLCGDDVLRTLGETVTEIFSQEAVLCRWGGDEFLFFLIEEKGNEQRFTERMELLRKKMDAYQYQQTDCPVSLSIGGARSYPGCTFDVLFQQADDALYLAKKNGKDQFWLYAPTEQKSDRGGREENVQ